MPKFFYFDLGNVLLTFDHGRAARQMAAVCGVEPETIWRIVFEGDAEDRYESGKLTSEAFYDLICRRLNDGLPQEAQKRPDRSALLRAAADIFEVHVPLVPIVMHMKAAGYRLGILSNTNEAHWNWVSGGRYRFLKEYFEVHVLSYRVGTMKPAAAIYEAAVARVDLPPADIFFVDDRADNVQGARACGLDAVPFTTAVQLARDLHDRGVCTNY